MSRVARIAPAAVPAVMTAALWPVQDHVLGEHGALVGIRDAGAFVGDVDACAPFVGRHDCGDGTRTVTHRVREQDVEDLPNRTQRRQDGYRRGCIHNGAPAFAQCSAKEPWLQNASSTRRPAQ